jgi:hypothetical protein
MGWDRRTNIYRHQWARLDLVTERKLLVLSIISDARVAASLTGNENNKSLSGSRHKSSATLRKETTIFRFWHQTFVCISCFPHECKTYSSLILCRLFVVTLQTENNFCCDTNNIDYGITYTKAYSGCPGFKSRPREWLSWLKFFVVFLSPSCQESTLNWVTALPSTSFPIHHSCIIVSLDTIEASDQQPVCHFMVLGVPRILLETVFKY